MWTETVGIITGATMQLLALGALVMLSLSILRRV